jgi:hypothetical protein
MNHCKVIRCSIQGMRLCLLYQHEWDFKVHRFPPLRMVSAPPGSRAPKALRE